LITVIIVNWNGRQFIGECLDGLRRQTVNNFSTILVDNASSDDSLDFIRENYPEVETLALSDNLGFAVANNLVIKTVKTEFVALLNPDAIPDSRWLECLLKALDGKPEAGMAASKMLLYDRPALIDRAGDAYTTAGTALLRGRGELSRDFSTTEWVFGACAGAAIYRRQLFDDIGFFDEDFFLLYEDVDLSFRAQLRGHRSLFVPDAVVYHRTSSIYYSHRNLEWVYICNMPGNLILRTIFRHIIYDVAALLFFSAKGRLPDFIKAKWHALRGLKRALHKRRRIQSGKRVFDDYVWNILTKEKFFPRLTRRLTPR